MNARISAYYLSTNRERTHWFLWLRQYDDNWGRWDESVIDLCATMKKVPSEVAEPLTFNLSASFQPSPSARPAPGRQRFR